MFATCIDMTLLGYNEILPDRHRLLPIAITRVAIPHRKRDAHGLAGKKISRLLIFTLLLPALTLLTLPLNARRKIARYVPMS
jgi:hypothetical protein